jgi:hypothetical protein
MKSTRRTLILSAATLAGVSVPRAAQGGGDPDYTPIFIGPEEEIVNAGDELTFSLETTDPLPADVTAHIEVTDSQPTQPDAPEVDETVVIPGTMPAAAQAGRPLAAQTRSVARRAGKGKVKTKRKDVGRTLTLKAWIQLPGKPKKYAVKNKKVRIAPRP